MRRIRRKGVEALHVYGHCLLCGSDGLMRWRCHAGGCRLGASLVVVIFNVVVMSCGCGVGSERADKTGATDERLKEAMNINKYVGHTHICM